METTHTQEELEAIALREGCTVEIAKAMLAQMSRRRTPIGGRDCDDAPAYALRNRGNRSYRNVDQMERD